MFDWVLDMLDQIESVFLSISQKVQYQLRQVPFLL